MCLIKKHICVFFHLVCYLVPTRALVGWAVPVCSNACFCVSFIVCLYPRCNETNRLELRTTGSKYRSVYCGRYPS